MDEAAIDHMYSPEGTFLTTNLGSEAVAQANGSPTGYLLSFRLHSFP